VPGKKRICFENWSWTYAHDFCSFSFVILRDCLVYLCGDFFLNLAFSTSSATEQLKARNHAEAKPGLFFPWTNSGGGLEVSCVRCQKRVAGRMSVMCDWFERWGRGKGLLKMKRRRDNQEKDEIFAPLFPWRCYSTFTFWRLTCREILTEMHKRRAWATKENLRFNGSRTLWLTRVVITDGNLQIQLIL